MISLDISNTPGPGLLRRLVVIVYDGLLLAGVILASWAILWLLMLAIPEGIKSHPAVKLFQQCYLLVVTFLFYGWFWVYGGQTLGMRVWRMVLVTESGEPVTWRQVAARYLGALLSWAGAAMGFMWVLVDREL